MEKLGSRSPLFGPQTHTVHVSLWSPQTLPPPSEGSSGPPNSERIPTGRQAQEDVGQMVFAAGVFARVSIPHENHHQDRWSCLVSELPSMTLIGVMIYVSPTSSVELPSADLKAGQAVWVLKCLMMSGRPNKSSHFSCLPNRRKNISEIFVSGLAVDQMRRRPGFQHESEDDLVYNMWSLWRNLLPRPNKRSTHQCRPLRWCNGN